MIPLDSKNPVGNLVEFLHLAFSQQCAEILDDLSFFEDPSNHEILLVFFDLIPVMVSDRYMSPTIFFLFGLELKRLCDCFLGDVLISRLFDCGLTLQHVLDG